MIISILSVLLVALLVPLLQRFSRNYTGYWLAILPTALFGYFTLQFIDGAGASPVRQSFTWNRYFDLELAFYLDGLSLLFSLLITGIGALIFIYAANYMKAKPHQARFYSILTLFMGAMLGLVLADNLLSLVVFWELTSITSFLLIGFENVKSTARKAALQALLVTGIGGLVLLAGLVLMGQVGETYSISELLNKRETLQESALYLPILLCVLFAAFTKSAQVPFHFWLPNAMAAPTPVSAYLHSATMVKAGVYLVARFSPALAGSPEWELIVSIAGGLSMLTGAILAFRSSDLKQLLAYSTISALGIMMLALGIGTEAAVSAGLAYIVAHALYKSTLFMAVGILDKKTGTRDIRKLPSGLYRSMKFTALLVLMAALSFGGILPFFGFVAKEMLLKMALQASFYHYLLIAALLVSSAFFVALVLILLHRAFIKGGKNSESAPQYQTSYLFHLAPAVTAFSGLALSLFTGIPSRIITQASASIHPEIQDVHLTLWHGWNTELWLSIISIIAGVGIYLCYRYFNRVHAIDHVLKTLYPSRLYNQGVTAMLKLAKWQTGKLQSGHLRQYVMITLLSILLLTGFTFFYKAGFRLNTEIIEMYTFEIVLGIIAIIALVFLLAKSNEIGAILALGIIAIVVSIIFLEYGAPDIAITWFLVDTLTVTLFVLVIHKLPIKVVPKSKIGKVRDAGIAVGMGALITFILFSITYDPLDSKLKEFYAAKSYPEAHGKNIVNTILVDFRALDTFGEITVLAIAALGVYALINFSRKPIKKKA